MAAAQTQAASSARQSRELHSPFACAVRVLENQCQVNAKWVHLWTASSIRALIARKKVAHKKTRFVCLSVDASSNSTGNISLFFVLSSCATKLTKRIFVVAANFESCKSAKRKPISTRDLQSIATQQRNANSEQITQANITIIEMKTIFLASFLFFA